MIGTVRTANSPRFFRRLIRQKLAVACLAYLAIIVLIGIIAPLALPGISNEQAGDLLAVHQGPSAAHLLGTDTLGRDVLERLLVGARVTVVGVAEALVVVLLLGVPVGLVAGYFGGWVDRIAMWLADLSFAVPGIVVVLMVLSVFPESMLAAMVTYGVLVAPMLARVVRAAVLPVKQELYISAAQVSGLSRTYVISRHVLPRVAGPIVVQASFLAALALLAQTGLAFLGLLVRAPAPSWGGMVADGANVILLQPWLIWPSGIAIALTILALGLLGDSVRDAMTETWAPLARRVRRRTGVTHGSSPIEPAPDPSALLSIRGLRVEFASGPGRDVCVVDDVSFDVYASETVGLIGESGCGKTATAMSVLGLLPGSGRVKAGAIYFDGRDLTTLTETELHRIRGGAIGLVSQEPMVSFNPTFRVGSQLAEVVRRHTGLKRAAARSRVLDLLRQVHLPAPEVVARRYPHELSGGMAQRVAVARALAGEPKLLIADEPTTALDVTVQAEILELLRELQRESGMAILLITHDWGVVADICDRAIVLYAGQVVERAPLLPMFREPLHPYTKALLAANPHGAHEEQVLPSIPGVVPPPGQWPQGCHFYERCDYATSACGQGPISLQAVGDGRVSRCIHHDRLSSAT
jgi:peptide/nickel transport system permease protein